MIVLIRFACLLWWIAASIFGVQAVEERDWHLLVVQVAESLIALVLWFSVSSDSDRLHPPTFGTPSMRRALYSITLLLSVSAFVSWQWPLRGASLPVVDTGLILFGVLVIGGFLNAEWKRRVTP